MPIFNAKQSRKRLGTVFLFYGAEQFLFLPCEFPTWFLCLKAREHLAPVY